MTLAIKPAFQKKFLILNLFEFATHNPLESHVHNNKSRQKLIANALILHHSSLALNRESEWRNFSHQHTV